MKIYKGFDDTRLVRRPRAVAIGIFDGVHRGHQKILNQVLEDARRRKVLSMAVTFDPHPVQVLKPGAKPPILMSLSHRLRAFERMGLSETLVVGFNKKFSRISADFFLDKLLIERLGMRSLAVGRDFRFGRGGAGDAAFLKRLSKEKDFRLSLIAPLRHRREVISSTRIRRLIERGRLKKAARMLGRPVSVYGRVVRGRGRGKGLGFPTANLDPHHETLPPSGVYAARGRLGKKNLYGVIHIGERPTFGDREKNLEVHFLNFRGDLYGKELELIFVSRLRGIRRFPGPRELAAAIRKDVRQALKILYKPALSKYNLRATWENTITKREKKS